MECVKITLPLCNSQHSLWSLEQLAPGTSIYNQVVLVRFEGLLDPAGLRAALTRLLARHGALRTVFHAAADGPVQQVLSRVAADCPLEDLSALPERCRDAVAHQRIGEVRRQLFDLARGPLLRFRLFRSGPRRHELLLVVHHLVMDGRSAQIFVDDLIAFYLGADPAPPPLRYDELVLREAALALEGREAGARFWRSFLGTAPKLFEVPTDRPRPQRTLLPAGNLSRLLPADLGARVAACAREQRTSTFRLLVAAFSLLLHRITGETEVVVAATFPGRGRPGAAQVVGMFVNMLPCVVRFEAQQRFCDLLARVSADVGEMGRHQLCPPDEIATLLGPGSPARRWSSYSAMINQVFDYSRQSHVGRDLQAATEVLFERDLTPFDLALQCAAGSSGLRLLFEYGAELFDRTTVQRIAQRFETLLRGVVEAPEEAVDVLPLLGATERHQLAVEWNDTAAEIPREPSLPGMFRSQALRRPDAAAVVSGELTLSYGELDARSSRLAARLRQMGVGPEQAVGLCCDRCADWALGMLGILKAGGFYVPLDLEYPQERLELMIVDTGMTVVLTRGELRRRLPGGGTGLRILDPGAETLPAEAWEGEASGGARLAYVLYTSGSTGRPKGIGIPHRAIVRLVLGNRAGLTPGQRMAQASNMGFDAATYEVWGALLRGGTLLEIPRETLLSLWKMPGELRRLGIDTLVQTSALFSQLAREQPDAFSALRELFVGGDALDPEAVRRVLENGGPQHLYNGYGPTECTTFAVWHRVTPESASREGVPLGHPIANTRVVLCDRHLQPVPLGTVGELCIGGGGLARGYPGRGDLTAERFVPSVLGDEPGGRLYRTGDLARWLPAGELVFLGRFDHQVKVRGFRVELGEIEAALREHADVREAAVVFQREKTEGRLIAYVVPQGGRERGGLPAATLRAFLARRLPEYMIPAAFVALDDLPLNANLKLDRRSLPAPQQPEDGEDRGGAAALGPRTGTESALAAIWEEVLELPEVGAHDDFFAAGGHSLLATRVLSRVRGVLGAELTLRDLFEAPTVAGLAQRIEALLRERRGLPPPPPLAPLPRDGGGAGTVRFPLSFGQLGLWFLDRLFPGRASYNVPVAFRLEGPLDVPALEHALSVIVERHESLRTVFVAGRAETGEPAQEVRPPEPRALPVVDLAGLDAAARGAEVRRLAELEALRPFDLETGPLLRGGLVRLSGEEHALLLTVHHIVFDGWSLEVFHRELGVLYGAFRGAGEPGSAPLPALEVQYGDFATWQRSCLSEAVLATQLDVWRRRLGDELPALELPTDRPRPALPAFRGGACALRLPPGLTESLQAVSHRRATRAMALLAGFQSLLHRLSGQDRVVVGMPVAGRGAREVEGLVGLFVNHLLMVGDLGDDPSFAAYLERVRDVVLDANAQQELPFDQLVQALRPERDLSRNPLSQIAFAWQANLLQAPRLAGLTVAPLPLTVRRTRFDLELHLWQAGAAVEAICVYDTDLFDAATIQRLTGQLVRLLAAAAASPETPVGRLSFLAAAERHQLLVEERERTTAYPRTAGLHELFARQAVQRPDAVAVAGPAGEASALTYGELHRRSRRLAWRLRRMGVGAEQAVGLCFDRCADWVEGMLGILAAGGFYVPLDPRYPPERLGLMVAGAGMAVVLTRGTLRRLLPEHGADLRVVDFDGLDAEAPAGPPGEAERAELACGERLAYMLYTSGSTGRPKGIGVPQRAVARLVLATDYVELGPGDRMSQVSNLGFDASTFEVWGALLNGGTLVEIPREVLLSPARIAEELRGRGIDTMLLTSAVFHHLAGEVPEAFATLRDLLVGGDVLEPVQVRRVLERGRPRRLLNGYGPTESTTFAAWHQVTEESASRETILLGRPIANTRVVVCDRRLEPVPLGVVGELCIGGDGLARGYLGRGDLTAERFVPSPVEEEAGGRLYRTGDLARRLPSGELEFLGRFDHQVKVRGVRVELGEIEAALREHPAVRDAVVLYRRGEGEEGRLLSWVVPRPAAGAGGDGEGLAPSLRAFLRERLPEPMLPAWFVVLDALPLTANGKVDRAALALPRESRPVAEAPRDPLEESLAAVWAEALGLPAVGIGEDFFALGGHSLLATRVVSRVGDLLGLELPLRSLFEAPTVARMADAVRSVRDGVPAPPPLVPCARPAEATFPLSFAQERLWFLDLLAPGSTFYNISYAVRLAGPLDPPALAAALDEIERRHEILRTTFPVVAGEAAQKIGPPRSPGLPRVDLGALAAPRRAAEVRRLQDAEAARPFSLAAGPLWRAVLLCLEPGDHVLLFGQHHVISDGWSVGVFHRELEALYGAFREGRRSPLPPLGLQYADYTVWQRGWLQGEALEAQIGYWRNAVGTAPPALHLPIDRPRPLVQTFRGAARRMSLPPGLVAGLRSLGRRRGATQAVTLLAGFFALLARLTGQDRVLVGSPVAGRSRQELEALLGFFVNSLVMVGDLRGEPSFRELLERVREMALGAYAHQDLPFERLVNDLAPQRDLSRNPLFQAIFVFQNGPVAAPELSGLRSELLDFELRTTHFDLELHLWDAGAGVEGGCVFDADLFDATTIQRLLAHSAALLEAAVASPETPVTRLPLLAPAERHLLLAEWNDTAVAARGGTVAELILHQAGQRPDAVAVTGGDLHLSYGALATRSSRLAARLRRLGVGPEAAVGVSTGRSPEVAVAFLGVLLAGGAYLPLDPELPRRRLEWLLRDAGAVAVVTTAALVTRLPGVAEQVRCLLVEDAAVGGGEERALAAPETAGGDLAYVIYTSGSTGQPKGVEVTQRSLLNLVLWHLEVCGLGPADRMSQVAAVGFDISVLEILSPLAAGASLHFPSADVRRDPVRLGAWLTSAGVTSAFFPTPLVHALLDRPLPSGLALRSLLTGGEALHPVQAELPFPLVNLYGPTEGTVVATGGAVERGEPVAPPIGRPLAGVRAVVVDPQGEPLPPGISGELWLGGVCPARGYRGRPDLTAERFVPDPFAPVPGARMYRTGDRVRTLGDGRLEFLGRFDHQVKVRGFRIEPDEIAAALREHAAVREAVVAVHRGGGPDAEPRLIAWVLADGEPDLAAELRLHLQSLLPSYMVPSAIVRLDALPLTPHGKVDRRALPLPDDALRPAAVSFVAPQTTIQRSISEVWQRILAIEAIGIDDPFFDLGGNSLAMARAASLLETALERPVPLVSLFRFPTVRSLAEHLGGGMEKTRSDEVQALREIEQKSRQRWQTQDRRRRERHEHRF